MNFFSLTEGYETPVDYLFVRFISFPFPMCMNKAKEGRTRRQNGSGFPSFFYSTEKKKKNHEASTVLGRR